ncbi:hypothetical protein CANCADRAFT_57424 [Tortispora caseinolytica NRRL Y-17796]|uniref:GST C-terminal domain-containing protein n=1 Tax=Tortispora caseinolytica NRRL Y-17796 TaxID=767744 RepID=A0A1E4TH37_9ASCO|nr:hypothetical protein CANCADRAFT_57424 [Tortispora caseinolytica NRRL Y-17796]
MTDQRLNQASEDGKFHRQSAQFRSSIGDDKYPAEKGRYILYYSPVCPWAGRTLIFRKLKELEGVIDTVQVSEYIGTDGWFFTGTDGSPESDPRYGFRTLKELYHMVDPNYNLRFTVPVLFDTKTKTIVNNESSEIIRMLNSGFSSVGGNDLDLYPELLRSEIDEFNELIYHTLNNGVYKTGFAETQEAYDENVYKIFETLDYVEEKLKGKDYVIGDILTESDVRLFVTIARFDVAYFTIFRCNLRMIRYEYPNIDRWYRGLYYNNPAFKETIDFDLVKRGYSKTRFLPVPAGPIPAILPKSQ